MPKRRQVSRAEYQKIVQRHGSVEKKAEQPRSPSPKSAPRLVDQEENAHQVAHSRRQSLLDRDISSDDDSSSRENRPNVLLRPGNTHVSAAATLHPTQHGVNGSRAEGTAPVALKVTKRKDPPPSSNSNNNMIVDLTLSSEDEPSPHKGPSSATRPEGTGSEEATRPEGTGSEEATRPAGTGNKEATRPAGTGNKEPSSKKLSAINEASSRARASSVAANPSGSDSICTAPTTAKKAAAIKRAAAAVLRKPEASARTPEASLQKGKTTPSAKSQNEASSAYMSSGVSSTTSSLLRVAGVAGSFLYKNMLPRVPGFSSAEEAPGEKTSGLSASDVGAAEKIRPSTVEPLSARSKTCWACRVELELPDGQFCLYTKHAHPLFPPTGEDSEDGTVALLTSKLAAFACSSCAEELVENDKRITDQKEKEEHSPDICTLCLMPEDEEGDDGKTLPFFLCDGCPRAVCQTCVATCHGGGMAGYDKALSLEKSNEKWMCPLCEPPRELYNAMPENGETRPRTAENVLDELRVVEAELQEVMGQFDWEDEKRREITAELSVGGRNVSQEEVDEEMDLLHEQMAKHEDRLRDTCSHLQEELENVHDLDLAIVYEKCLGQAKALGSTADGKDWVRDADRAIKERNDNSPKRKLPKCPKDAWDEVEDLATEDSRGVLKPKAKGFESIEAEADSDDEREAFEAEEHLIRQNNVQITVVKERDDERVKKERATRHRSRLSLDEFRPLAVRRKKQPRGASIRTGSGGRDKSTRTDARDVTEQGAALERSSAMGATAAQSRSPNKSVDSSTSLRPKISAAGATAAAVRTSSTKKAVPELDPQDYLPIHSNRRQSLRRKRHEIFKNSRVVFNGTDIAVAREVACKLKEQQKQAVQFMFKNCFADYVDQKADPGGCILAHHMGLGKTLSTIALVQSVLLHDMGQRVVVMMPKNVAVNWKYEFSKWIGGMNPQIAIYELTEDTATHRVRQLVVQDWHEKGGVLLITPHRAAKALTTKADPDDDKSDCTEKLQSADLVVIDEAHQCLKSDKTKISSALASFKSQRRICLTGTPLQNNLMEYYRMVKFVRPDLLGPQTEFEREFAEPIGLGLMKDCTPEQLKESKRRTVLLHQKLDPFIHRKDATPLKDELPILQQVVLHVRQTKLQARLYRQFKRTQQATDSKNFFRAFAALKPIHNHPGSLLCKSSKQKCDQPRTPTEDDVVVPEDDQPVKDWWDSITKNKEQVCQMEKVDHGFKIVLLLHILVEAQRLNEKVVVFSQCIKTLDFVEKVLSHRDWLEHTKSLSESLGDETIGGWEKGRDYLRIDGATSSNDRGGSIKDFQNNNSIRAFLLSTVAGGVGINLVAASRAVLLDTHFNPALSEQAIFRLYRYGQTKQVFVYKFLTEGSMEEKIYARAVTKTGLALKIVDKKNIKRYFTERELADLQHNFNWVQCEKCQKWRVLLGGDSQSDLPDVWECKMNDTDPKNNSCSFPERGQQWYEAEMHRLTQAMEAVSEEPRPMVAEVAKDEETPTLSEAEQHQLEQNDKILQKLLAIKDSRMNTSIISKHVFHQDLVIDEHAGTSTQKKPSKTPSPGKGRNQSSASRTRSASKRVGSPRLQVEQEKENSRIKASPTERTNSRKRKILHEEPSTEIRDPPTGDSGKCSDGRDRRSRSDRISTADWSTQHQPTQDDLGSLGKTSADHSGCPLKRHLTSEEGREGSGLKLKSDDDDGGRESVSTSQSRRSRRVRQEPNRLGSFVQEQGNKLKTSLGLIKQKRAPERQNKENHKRKKQRLEKKEDTADGAGTEVIDLIGDEKRELAL